MSEGSKPSAIIFSGLPAFFRKSLLVRFPCKCQVVASLVAAVPYHSNQISLRRGFSSKKRLLSLEDICIFAVGTIDAGLLPISFSGIVPKTTFLRGR